MYIMYSKCWALTCIFIDNIRTLYVPCDSLNAGLFAAHFLEKRMVSLQI